MSKNRRKVTVEGDKSSDDEGGAKRNKPSVFERLGPGSAPRKSFEGDERCRNWVKTGSCPYGATCRFLHPPFKGGRSKRKGEGPEEGGEDSKHRKHRGEKDKHRSRQSQSASPKRGSRGSHVRREKDGKMKSAVVVRKRLGRGGGDSEADSDSAPWPEVEDSTFEDLDYKDELQLEQKRQELERVLQQLQPSEEERENITIQKKQASSSSDSSSSSGSSSGSSSSGSSSSGSPSPPRKKKTAHQKSPSNLGQRHGSPGAGYRGKSPVSHHLRSPPVAPQRRSGSPQQFRNSPQPGAHATKTQQSGMDKLMPPHRDKHDKLHERSSRSPKSTPKSTPIRDAASPPAREHAPRREITPTPQDRSQESTPSRPSSPSHSSAWSPEKSVGYGSKGGKASGKRKKGEKQKERGKGKGPRTPSPSEWEPQGKVRDKDHRRPAGMEKEKPTHKEKHKRRNRSPVLEEKMKRQGHSRSPPPNLKSKLKGERAQSPESEHKRSEVSGRHDTDSDHTSPQRKSRKSLSPTKEKSKRKKRGRTLSVSPLRTKKLSPGPSKSKESVKEGKEARLKAKLRDAFPDMPGQSEERTPEPEVKVKSRGRSPGQAPPREKHKKKKDSSADKKKRKHDSPEIASPPKHSRKRRESPETPVKASKRGSVEKSAQVSPMKRSSRSKSGKRKDGRKGHKGQADWETGAVELEDKGRGRGEVERDRDGSRHRADRPPSPEHPPQRGRESRRSPPPEPFEPRNRSGGDGRRPASPPRRPESPGDSFRQSARGSPPRFARGAREEPGYPPAGRRRPDEDYGHPPGSVSPPTGRRGRDGRFRDEFEPGHGRRDPDPDGLRNLERYMDPRDRERLGRFPDIRPLFDDRPGSRAEQERLFEMERERFERETDRLRGREGFDRDRYGRERFPPRSDRFDDGRAGGLVGRDPRPLGVGGPPWERDFPREGSRGLPGDRFPPGRGFDDAVPERLSRRGDWESRRMEFRDEWNPRNRGDDRRDMRLGRRGEFLDVRDSRRFEDPGMFRRLERDEMLRIRMDAEFRDRRDPSNRREPSDPREMGFAELRGRDERLDDGPERDHRDDRREDRRREDREGDRKMDRRDDSRKRPHDMEDERGRSPPVKRQRELSPGATSLRSRGSNFDDLPAERDSERGERDRRRDRSQDVGRRDREKEGDRLSRSGRDSEDRRSRDQEFSRERDGPDTEKESGKPLGRERVEDKDKERGLGRIGDVTEASGIPSGEDPDTDSKRSPEDIERNKERSSSDKAMSVTRETEEREADRESVKSSGRRSLKDHELRRDRSLQRDTFRGSPDISRERARDRDLPPERERDSLSDRGSRREYDRDRDSLSEKGFDRGAGRDRDSISERGFERSSRQERYREDLRERDTLSDRVSNRDREMLNLGRERHSLRDRDRQGREMSGEPGYVRDRDRGREGDSLSESGRRSNRGRDRPASEFSDHHGDRHQEDDHKRSPHRHLSGDKSVPVDSDKAEIQSDKGSVKEQPRSNLEGDGADVKLKDPDNVLSTEEKGGVVKQTEDKSEMYDPFDVESNDGHKEDSESMTTRSAVEKPIVEDKASESRGQKRRLSTGSGEEVTDGQQKKQRMIELTDGTLSETVDPDARQLLNVESQGKANSERTSQVPFSGETPERDDGRSHGDVYSDWSSADDADDILAQPEAVPFSALGAQQDIHNGDGPIGDERRRSLSRSRRSPSRSSHGSRRDRRGEDRGRERSHGDRRPGSRHSSYDPQREDRRRLESVERGRRDDWDRMDNKPDQSEVRMAIPTETDDGDVKGDLMDYEAISDDEDIGTEDDTDSKGVVSALQINWSSLTQDQRPAMTPGSALNRFKPAVVFSRIGIEAAYAGEELLGQITASCQSQVEEDEANRAASPEMENGKGDDSDSKPDPKFTLHHSIAAFHATTVLKLKERAELFRNIGPFRRALCARKDLDIRRQLCKMDKVLGRCNRFSHRPTLTGQT